MQGSYAIDVAFLVPHPCYKYFLKLPAAIFTASPNKIAPGNKITSGWMLTGYAR